ncbi:hypothetical protein CASFOL_037913 [Castilleja foliolosa]|uniref:RING-type domain-containing protein n=1 Tax=Castilleja foliolosa TaxID=1961234 RepID=A0ABD3BJY0_9LAMI
MGSKLGYAYDFRLKMMEKDEITSKFTSEKKDGVKTFIFEFTTNFILKIRPKEEEEASDLIIGSERFDAFLHPTGDEELDLSCLSFMVYRRLKEYWMTPDEINLTLNETLDFTRNLASDPQYVRLNQIPVLVSLEVRTVQQEGEAYNDALDRAIRAEHLCPLDMYPIIAMGAFRPMCYFRKSFLRKLSLRKVRVENVEEGLALMPVCPICSRSGKLGAWISTLPKCGHAFHYHCVFRWIEANGMMCPSCFRPGYDRISELL